MVVFEESQAFLRSSALKALLFAMAALFWLGLFALSLTDYGGDRVIGLVVGGLVVIGVSALLFHARLTVTVGDDLHIVFRPFTNRTIRFDEIASAEAVTYRPVLEYGGWGVRCGLKGTAYNVSGNRGVQLVLGNGKRVLIGSQRPEELARALQERTGRLS